MKLLMTLCCFAVSFCALSQSLGKQIEKGNELYNNQQYEKALESYKEAITQNVNSFAGQYNIANTYFKLNNFVEASKAYEKALAQVSTTTEKGNAYYNLGNSLVKQDKLEAAIEQYKNALKQNPKDDDARYNLTKAIKALQKKKNENQNQSKKPQPSNYNKQQIDQVLQMLRKKEKDVLEKMKNKQKSSGNKPEKDW
jgi:Ca-activated chloride channel homolog